MDPWCNLRSYTCPGADSREMCMQRHLLDHSPPKACLNNRWEHPVLATACCNQQSPSRIPLQASERYLDLELALQLHQSVQSRRMLCRLLIRTARCADLRVYASAEDVQVPCTIRPRLCGRLPVPFIEGSCAGPRRCCCLAVQSAACGTDMLTGVISHQHVGTALSGCQRAPALGRRRASQRQWRRRASL